VHLDPWGRNAHAVLDAALAAGADPGRLVLSHLDPALPDLAWLRGLAARGVFVAIDIWGDEDAYGGRGMPTDEQRIAAVLAAHDEGWADRLVLSQDVCLKSQLGAHGGRGYDHLLTTIAPRLRDAGLDEAAVDALLITNPGIVLAGSG
jgi:phosphotriesterase-related protein